MLSRWRCAKVLQWWSRNTLPGAAVPAPVLQPKGWPAHHTSLPNAALDCLPPAPACSGGVASARRPCTRPRRRRRAPLELAQRGGKHWVVWRQRHGHLLGPPNPRLLQIRNGHLCGRRQQTDKQRRQRTRRERAEGRRRLQAPVSAQAWALLRAGAPGERRESVRGRRSAQACFQRAWRRTAAAAVAEARRTAGQAGCIARRPAALLQRVLGCSTTLYCSRARPHRAHRRPAAPCGPRPERCRSWTLPGPPSASGCAPAAPGEGWTDRG